MPHSQLHEIFAKRDRDDKLITAKPEFLNLLLELEHKYRTMRSTKKVPEDEIISQIEVHKFMDEVNDKCLMLMMKRYVRMRSFFHAKQCARNQLRKKRLKTSALRKNLKTLH